MSKKNKAPPPDERPISQKEALYLAVLASPEDDMPRLAMADWYEENGEPERAEFIRTRVELDRARRAGWQADWKAGILTSQDPIREHGERLQNLQARAEVLTDRPSEKLGRVTNACHWLGSALRLTTGAHRHRINSAYMTRGFVDRVSVCPASWMGGPCPRCSSTANSRRKYHRVCGECGGTRWVDGLGPILVKHHPITRVYTCRVGPENVVAATIYVWRQETSSRFAASEVPACLPLTWEPYMVLGQCAVFTKPDLAHEALGDAMLAWAHQAADDPALFERQTEARKQLLLR